MLADSGALLFGIAAAATVYAALVSLWYIRCADRRWLASARNGMLAAAGLLGGALLLLVAALLADRFELAYVAANSSRRTPLLLKVSAVWAGQEGSLLLWAFVQALLAAVVARRALAQPGRLYAWALAILAIVTAFFVGVTLFLAFPFEVAAGSPVDGLGLNPLLRHPAMVLHPPLLYLGYVGLSVPFGLALAGLITGELETWMLHARRWMLFAWLFLGAGLLLGARWAYDVLGWGGYWGWDPVENAGLMPWLTATGALHALALARGRKQGGGFRLWATLLTLASFLLVLFGTFATRSGLIVSVHSFARSPMGPYFLGALIVACGVSGVLLAIRWRHLSDDEEDWRLLSRQGAAFITLVLLSTITLSVLIGSVLPALTRALAGQRFEAGPDWFDRVTGPQFAGLLLLLGVCPLLGRSLALLKRAPAARWWIPLACAAWVGAALLAGFSGWMILGAVACAGLGAAVAVYEIARDLLASRGRPGRSAPGGRAASWARTVRYGGYLVHLGVALLALGVIGTRMDSAEYALTLDHGVPATVAGYTLVYEDMQPELLDDRFEMRAAIAVSRGGRAVRILSPGVAEYEGSEQRILLPALSTRLREDLYLVLAGWDEVGAQITLQVFVNRLAVFLWIGGLLILAGGALAWRAVLADARVRQMGPMARAVGYGLALAAVVLGGWMMLEPGLPLGAEIARGLNPRGRPEIGQAAPEFELHLLDDGRAISLADFKGQVVALNFWASWCDSCKDELPALQAVWLEYRETNVRIIGVIFEDDVDKAGDVMRQFGVTFSQALDTGLRATDAFGVTGLPETYVIDAAGEVVAVHIGPISAETLRGDLDRALGN